MVFSRRAVWFSVCFIVFVFFCCLILWLFSTPCHCYFWTPKKPVHLFPVSLHCRHSISIDQVQQSIRKVTQISNDILITFRWQKLLNTICMKRKRGTKFSNLNGKKLDLIITYATWRGTHLLLNIVSLGLPLSFFPTLENKQLYLTNNYFRLSFLF